MKRQPIILGIILVLLLSSMSSIVIGFNTEKIDRSIQSVDGPMDSPWPTYGYNNRHTCQSTYNTDKNPGLIKWRFKTERGGFESSPVIDNNGILYIGCLDGFIYAINPNGTEKWRYECNDWILSSPAIADDGTIYVGSLDDHLYSINSDGTLKWRFHAEASIFGSPTIGEDDVIYFGSMKSMSYGKVYALYSNGAEKWHYDAGDSVYGTPAIGEDGTVYITSNDKKLHAINPSNGSMLWSCHIGDALGSPSIGDDGTIYVASHNDYLYAIYPNGTRKWRTEIDVGSHGTPAISSDGTIYIGGSFFFAVNPNGSIKWVYEGWEKYDYEVRSNNYAISADGTIYFVITQYSGWGGDLVALNPNGTLRWRKKIADNSWQFGIPVIDSNGTIYVANEFEESGQLWGYLYAFGDVKNNSSPDKPEINGPSPARVRKEQNYTFIINDIDNDEVYLWVDWGDDSNTRWIGPYNSSEEITLSHTWNKRGSYTISAKAKDMHDVEGEWQFLEIKMPKYKPLNIFNPWINRLIEKYPITEFLIYRANH
jgi:outer membrane protein assembly factor BamB